MSKLSKILKTLEDSLLNFLTWKRSFQVIVVCLLISLVIPSFLQAASVDQLRQDLENQIKQKQTEINQYQQSIQENQQKARTLKNEIQILEDQINKMRLEIKQIDLVIEESTLNIQEIGVQINDLENKIEQEKDRLAEYIRLVAYYDQETLLEVVLRNDKFSDFFDEINALESVQEEIQSVLGAIRGLKDKLEEQKLDLEDEREGQYRLRSFQAIQTRTVENKQWQKEDLLDKTKGQELRYQQLIQGTEKDIAYIREQLSLLERYNLTLEEAIAHAIFAASKSGLRPAFLLGVLEAESRLGLNVGTGNWQKDMYQCYRNLGYITLAEKQKEAFLQICQELGLNPDTQPVSAEPWYGCGGAMGVAQFMPATWLAYKERVIALTGNNPPNPWSHQDAFMAAAIKLSDGGANQRTELGERTAYAKYLAGSRYQRWIYHKITDYVIKLANDFQKEYFE